MPHTPNVTALTSGTNTSIPAPRKKKASTRKRFPILQRRGGRENGGQGLGTDRGSRGGRGGLGPGSLLGGLLGSKPKKSLLNGL